MEKKNPLKSKTLWTNFIVAAAALFAPEEMVKDINADSVLMMLASINMILRFVTKKPLLDS